MTEKILKIKNLQTDKEWFKDCQVIAIRVRFALNYNFNNVHNEDFFIECLTFLLAGRYVPEEHDGLSPDYFYTEISDLKESLQDQNTKPVEEAIEEVLQEINIQAQLYYATDKSYLLDFVNNLPKDVLFGSYYTPDGENIMTYFYDQVKNKSALPSYDGDYEIIKTNCKFVKKLLLVRRIQSDQEWLRDSLIIAERVKSLIDCRITFDSPYWDNKFLECLTFFISGPYMHKKNKFFKKSNVDISQLKKILKHQKTKTTENNSEDKQSYMQSLFQNPYARNLSVDDLLRYTLSQIKEDTFLYYSIDKPELIAKLSRLSKDVTFIYPNKILNKILFSFYKPINNKYVISNYDNDEESIKQFCEYNDIKDYEIVEIKDIEFSSDD